MDIREYKELQPETRERLRDIARKRRDIGFAHLSDEWVASTVRMLMRHDLDHEAICTTARDRIMLLSIRVEALEKQVYVPGVWKCAKCSCQVISTLMCAETGNVAANTEPQRCPNECGPMWRLTERDAGNALADRYEELKEKYEALVRTMVSEGYNEAGLRKIKGV